MTDIDRTSTTLNNRLDNDVAHRDRAAAVATDGRVEGTTRQHDYDPNRNGESLYGRAWGWSGANGQHHR